MKIFDCFTFFNELDLLDLRLNYLNNDVDYFVLVESNKTHSGQDKPYYYEENKARFDKFNKKIIHIKKEFVLISDNPSFWVLENEQRNGIIDGLLNSNDDDIILISDIDEIPNKDIFQRYKTKYYPEPISLIQKNHYYYFNCKSVKPDDWYGSVVVSKKRLNTPQEIRDNRMVYNRMKNGGWHFSYLGGVKNIVHKIVSFAHGEFNKPQFVNIDKLEKAIEQGEDIFDRNLKYIFFNIEDFKSEYPDYLVDNLLKYNQNIKEIKRHSI